MVLGRRKKKNTREILLAKICYNWSDVLLPNSGMLAVFVDLSKAFDKVYLQTLLNKQKLDPLSVLHKLYYKNWRFLLQGS